MRATLFVLLSVAGLAGAAEVRSFDHYDPGALVRAAREAMRADDVRTARVLLSRARQLAPRDARVEAAWGEYTARQGMAAAEPSAQKPEPEAPAPKPAASQAVAPEPPALWPAK